MVFEDIKNEPLEANGWGFAIPKNAKKASLILNLVEINKRDHTKPQKFSLPTLEELAWDLQRRKGKQIGEGIGAIKEVGIGL